ncbi:MAG: GerMN domain-containing protein [Acidimicrobiales bacterium]
MIRSHDESRKSRRSLIALLAIALLVTASCSGNGDDDVTTGSTTTSARATTTTTEPDPTTTPTTDAPTTTEPSTTAPTTIPAVDLETVNVYWLKDTGIAVGGREIDIDSGAAGAMAELLAGPNILETDLGMVSAVPAGTEVLGVFVDDGVATIDLSNDFETTGLGTSGEIGLVSQVVFTLTQFPTVDSVDITIDGEARDAILSHGLEATGLTREGFHDAIAPEIVVESPYPGEVITSPIVVSGFSRTFEASIVYSVIIPSGEIVHEGFTTAAQPDVHLFGPFEFVAEFEAGISGFGSVIVWEESALDGSQINTYEVPVRMEP